MASTEVEKETEMSSLMKFAQFYTILCPNPKKLELNSNTIQSFIAGGIDIGDRLFDSLIGARPKSRKYQSCLPSVNSTMKQLCTSIIQNFISTGMNINFRIPDTVHINIFPDSRSFAGYTLLHLAVEERNIEVVDLLLKNGADFTILDRNGFTVLHKAFQFWEASGKSETQLPVNLILSAHITSNNSSNPRCKNGISHLHIACAANHTGAVEFFLDSKVSVNEVINPNSPKLAGYTPLHVATRYNSLETLEILLKQGGDVNHKNAENLTPLNMLVKRSMDISDVFKMGKRGICTRLITEYEANEAMIKLFLKFGQFDLVERLHILSILTDKSGLEELLNQDVDVNSSIDSSCEFFPGFTALHFAAYFNAENVQFLLQNGANILTKDARGITPLDLCVQRYKPAELYSILSVHENLKNIRFSDGCTKLSDLILAMENCSSLETFLKNMDNVDAFVPEDSALWPGYTPLHIAVALDQRTIDTKTFYQNTNDNKICSEIYNCTKDDNKSCSEIYNCTNEGEDLYYLRIQVCLGCNCSVYVKNAEGSTPIHQAFWQQKSHTLSMLLVQMAKKLEENPVDATNLSHFHIACAFRSSLLIERFLNIGVDVNSQIRKGFDFFHPNQERFWQEKSIKVTSGSTALHIAVIFGQHETVKLLLKNGANAYTKDTLNLIPVHYNILNWKNMVNDLITLENVKECADNEFNLSLLHYTNDVNVIEALVEQGANINAAIKSKDCNKLPFLSKYNGWTPLHFALRDRRMNPAIKVLLNHGADIYAKDGIGLNPLQIALRSSYADIDPFIEALKDDEMKLHIACLQVNVQLVQELLTQGVDVNKQIFTEYPKTYLSGYTPMHCLLKTIEGCDTITQDFRSIFSLLCDYGVDVTIKNAANSTPVHVAYEMQQTRKSSFSVTGEFRLFMVQRLLKLHTNYRVNPVNNEGLSFLHISCAVNLTDSVKGFIEHLNIDIITNPFADHLSEGFTPLHSALMNCHLNVARLLMENGADVKKEDRYGNTPLHLATKFCYHDLQLLENLLSMGANIQAENVWGQTPFEVLLRTNNATINCIEFFLDNGCSILAKNPITSEGMLAFAFKHPNRINDLETLFTTGIEKSIMSDQYGNGISAIHNLVSFDYSRLESEHYIDIIDWLMEIGCDLDHQDQLDKTALHVAVEFKNLEAVKALLMMGIDVNRTDKNRLSAIDFCIESCKTNDFQNHRILKIFLTHLWKMKSLEMDNNCVKNKEAYRLIQEKYPIETNEKECFEEELQQLKNIEVYSRGSLFDMFYKSNLLIKYPTMSTEQRKTIDAFFICTNEVIEKYPKSCGLLLYQYRRAQASLQLLEPATDAFIPLKRLGSS